MPAGNAKVPAPLFAQLLSLAVHEFRTPASVVAGYLRMLQRDAGTPLDDRHRRMVEEAEKSCARLAALVGELNEIAKLDDPAVALPQETFDLVAMIREAAAEAHGAAEGKVRIEVRGRATGAPTKGDAVRLHAALRALVRAALREQSDDACLVVDYRQRRQGKRTSAFIIVAAQDDLARAVTAPEARFDEMRGGLGLALPIARRVIERHGGRLWSPPSTKGGLGSRSSVLVLLPL